MLKFQDKDEDKDEIKSNKLISQHIDNEKLLKKHETVSTKIEDLRNTELDA